MMIKKFVLIVLMGIPLTGACQSDLKLWYQQPATNWTEALPLGNGRLGAMMFGGVKRELLQLNESTLWTGGPARTNANPDAYSNLLLTRNALFKEEDYAKAESYIKKMQGYFSESYLPLGDLLLTQDFVDTVTTAYYRDLDIKNAISTTCFTIAGTTYTRQMFSSAPDQVMVMHLTASKAGQLNFKITSASQLIHQSIVISNNEIGFKGKAPSHIEPDYIQSNHPITQQDTLGCRGMRFELLIQATSNDGTISSDTSGMTIKNATEVTIYLSAATSFNGFDKCPDSEGKDEDKLAKDYLKAASEKSWQSLLAAHVADYHHYFDRVSFHLAASAINTDATLPTDQRLLAYTKGAKDPVLETLYFQYGRYLLISSSRPGGVNANLQGIWNKEIRPPWSSNYTTNINAEMNYWPAEGTNLSEMALPFIDFIKNVAVTGKVTARQFYHARGWAVHHNSDIWALSNPVGDMGSGTPAAANWAMGSPWLSQHLWWHYEFTKDKKFLHDTAYPLMKSAAQFCMDWLVDYKGYLVTAPSVSPENNFFDDKHQRGSVSIATTMDMSIIRNLFTNVIAASETLGEDKAFRDTIVAKRAKLFPLQIGKKGNIQEWYKDWEDPDAHHRHVSHLFGLFPGQEISAIKTPEFAAAAKKTLELRGDGGTGWSLAWKINYWARLLDGNHAYSLIRDLLKFTGRTSINYGNGGGSYANLFDAHPPFQIDGNFGGISGMTEMLLQSQDDEISLLPALPDAWTGGHISGLKARGNFVISINWDHKKLESTRISSLSGGICKVRTACPLKSNVFRIASEKTDHGYLTTFLTQKGKTYDLVSAATDRKTE
ncbi:glycoside hydrolase family 95 protein [Mucilaginibacter lappiensis]|uniref:Alpha-L-fucosidase 2 n=1 Tax=Mucilaginibacter lappiensis TaxID=354630 RepID=A0A841JKZ2_9SPHI|nr:glycoside hydrolase family 95 protein [Mucilaginibacter lappiensis]MBB6131124.1 alpha-L-fucosidase 2 [Mucilaginibacter lappiensis]